MVYDLNGTTLSTGGGSGMLNVLDHGFKGDGTTDNLAAFNALIAAHPARRCLSPHQPCPHTAASSAHKVNVKSDEGCRTSSDFNSSYTKRQATKHCNKDRLCHPRFRTYLFTHRLNF